MDSDQYPPERAAAAVQRLLAVLRQDGLSEARLEEVEVAVCDIVQFCVDESIVIEHDHR